jgi:hypothetical protein
LEFQMSVFSYPERGPWGKSSWRGNCSGYFYRDLFEALKPVSFADPMVGSGTSVEVARSMNIEAFGMDLKDGFNATKNSMVEYIGKQVSFTCSHPPYHDMIIYSGPGGQWGDVAHKDDLSHCNDVEEFHEMLQLVLLNQREATVDGGYYGTIIGDMRKAGKYHSLQAEAIARMPASELAGVLIKMQHNTVSSRKNYGGKIALPFIQHEYCLIWKKAEANIYSVLKTVANQAQSRLTGTWRNVVKQVLIGLGGQADLAKVYGEVERQCDKASSNAHWREKVRQILNSHPTHFKSIERGVWALA